MRTAAVDMGDHFVVNGQKMWCTGAGLPDAIVMYVRTDRDAPKHGGSSVCSRRGRAGRGLRRIPTLARHILGTYEVFLNDVEVPKDRLVGPLHGGWQVMLSSLELERILSAPATSARPGDARRRVESSKSASSSAGRSVPSSRWRTRSPTSRPRSTRPPAHATGRWLLRQGVRARREAAMAKLKGSETYVQRGPPRDADLARPRLLDRERHELPVAGVDRRATSPAAPARSSGTRFARDLGLKTY